MEPRLCSVAGRVHEKGREGDGGAGDARGSEVARGGWMDGVARPGQGYERAGGESSLACSGLTSV